MFGRLEIIAFFTDEGKAWQAALQESVKLGLYILVRFRHRALIGLILDAVAPFHDLWDHRYDHQSALIEQRSDIHGSPFAFVP